MIVVRIRSHEIKNDTIYNLDTDNRVQILWFTDNWKAFCPCEVKKTELFGELQSVTYDSPSCVVLLLAKSHSTTLKIASNRQRITQQLRSSSVARSSQSHALWLPSRAWRVAETMWDLSSRDEEMNHTGSRWLLELILGLMLNSVWGRLLSSTLAEVTQQEIKDTRFMLAPTHWVGIPLIVRFVWLLPIEAFILSWIASKSLLLPIDLSGTLKLTIWLLTWEVAGIRKNP